jgi:hypothetical protein
MLLALGLRERREATAVVLKLEQGLDATSKRVRQVSLQLAHWFALDHEVSAQPAREAGETAQTNTGCRALSLVALVSSIALLEKAIVVLAAEYVTHAARKLRDTQYALGRALLLTQQPAP